MYIFLVYQRTLFYILSLKLIMKILFLILLCFLGSISLAQSNKGKSGVSVVTVKTQSVLGSNLGYYVKFKNNSSSPVDGLKWTATFTDNFGKSLGTRSGQWQSGNFISAIKPGDTTPRSRK